MAFPVQQSAVLHTDSPGCSSGSWRTHNTSLRCGRNGRGSINAWTILRSRRNPKGQNINDSKYWQFRRLGLLKTVSNLRYVENTPFSERDSGLSKIEDFVFVNVRKKYTWNEASSKNNAIWVLLTRLWSFDFYPATIVRIDYPAVSNMSRYSKHFFVDATKFVFVLL